MADIIVVDTVVMPVSGSATLVQGTCGETITAGQTVYLVSGSTYSLCDVNGTDAIATLAGIAMTGGVVNQPLTVLTAGHFNPGVAVTKGLIYVASVTPGGIAPSADATTGWKQAVVGVATTTTNIRYIGYASLAAIA